MTKFDYEPKQNILVIYNIFVYFQKNVGLGVIDKDEKWTAK